MDKQKRVIVIGGGASGFMAAITAAKCGAKVTILEHMNNAARKIELTGNGRCNFTNKHMDITMFNSDNPDIVRGVLDKFSQEDTISFFEDLGIVTKDRNGYCYPMSGQAASVSAVLKLEAERLKIKTACNIDITGIEKKEDLFLIHTKGYIYEADALIIATGAKSYPLTGSDGSGFAFAKSFGHNVTGPYPALVKLLSKDKYISALAGLRVFGKVKLMIDNDIAAYDSGEIQFIKNGISGIPVFQVSRYASVILNDIEQKQHRKIKVSIDFVPEMSIDSLYEFMTARKAKNGYRNLAGFLTGMFNEKLISVFCSKMNVKGNIKVCDMTDEQISALCGYIKNTEFIIYATGDFNDAQVCCGGVPLGENISTNLESIIVPGLYFAGEILNVDGKCGGYNLQWAWSSGYVAGCSAGHNAGNSAGSVAG